MKFYCLKCRVGGTLVVKSMLSLLKLTKWAFGKYNHQQAAEKEELVWWVTVYFTSRERLSSCACLAQGKQSTTLLLKNSDAWWIKTVLLCAYLLGNNHSCKYYHDTDQLFKQYGWRRKPKPGISTLHWQQWCIYVGKRILTRSKTSFFWRTQNHIFLLL